MRTCESKSKKFRGGWTPILVRREGEDWLVFAFMGKLFRVKKAVFLQDYQPTPKIQN